MIAALTISRPAALVAIGVVVWLGLAVCLAVAIGLTVRTGDRREGVDVEPVAEDGGLALVADPAPGPEPATVPLPRVEDDLMADLPVEVLSGTEVDARFRQIVRQGPTWEAWL